MRYVSTILFCLIPIAAAADFEMRYSDGSQGFVSDGNVRFGDDADYMLALRGEDSVIIVTVEDRTWMRIDAEFMGDVQSAVEAQMAEMLAGMSPEERAMVEAQMGQMMPQMGQPPKMPKKSVRTTGRRDEVAGYDCIEAEVLDGDGSIEEIVCVATPDELGIDDDDFDTLVAAMRRITDSMSMDPDAIPEADFAELGGLPIKTRQSAHGDNAELVSIDTGRVDASRFEIPAGYTEVSVDDMMRN